MVTTTDGNSDNCPSQNTEPQARKDRKRVTDRLAQREHRRRQKLYVEELEAQLRVLKQESTTNQVGTLLEEIERLKNELKELRTFFSTIETLVQAHNKKPGGDAEAHVIQTPSSLPKGDEGDAPKTIEVCDPRHDLDGMNFDIGIETTVSRSPVAQSPQNTEVNCHSENVEIIEGNASHDPEFYPQMTQIENPLPGHTGSLNSDGNTIRDWWGLTAHDLEQTDSMDYTDSDMPLWINNFFAVGSLSPSDQLRDLGNPLAHDSYRGQQDMVDVLPPQYSQTTASGLGTSITGASLLHGTGVVASENRDVSLKTTSQLEAVAVGSQNTDKPVVSPGSSRSKIEVQIHRSLPHVLMPPLSQDTYVHEIIERARSNALSRRMLLDAPTLADFLVDNPTNVLSADLKKYLEPVRRSRRTAEYLGTYWVSYLLLRWQVNQSAESYERIPEWFRPTNLQMHVAHPIAVDFIAWPSLRDEVVKLSLSEPEKVHEVMTTIGVYLELDLGSTIAKSLTNEEVLNSAVCDLRNWKLRDGFFEIYPQWKGMCE
ncbi:hypothetical protein BGZ60DRAFT_164821 [Tricladium varicosporioides]|nr:hypothetical protein BGZ60DRAFT_164821 [Hymenoscyphus varicosporioides]